MNWEKRFDSREDNKHNELEEKFMDLIYDWSTAGNEINKLVTFLDEIGQDDRVNENLTKTIEEKREQIMRQFIRSVEGLKNGLLMADLLGLNAIDYTHAFAYPMEPTQYRHLPTIR
ncbi:hypothetical protein A2480_02385 [Candidatus Uhrbacteria bacterium RIFOXYC2_FULL_47_19]|uniref:Uncharacterized protein n=1 Tax=Candidatus Uhrbacteria bacterium RIFOXYC2_FULL_47_19 TaxID=1802424 RepID=A0A1F7WF31_9BACT|nr:MAG: hypothetical protein A2480_02385 [Candidatus Uhrbacteria bacterium RIFOXYC2_FULL_47_19]HCC22318.1 hypothetical protein [Candidatus Uhrbacteria bacterium]